MENYNKRLDSISSEVYLYSTDYLYENRNLKYFGIPDDKEAYILSFDIKYFSDKGDSKNVNNEKYKGILENSYISGKIFATINSRPNIHLITQESTYEYINIKNPGIYDNSSMLKILGNSNDRTCVCTMDNDLLIFKALSFKNQGKVPVIVTNNVNTMRNALFFGIKCIPNSLNVLDMDIAKLKHMKYGDKEDYKDLPCICFDTSYIMNCKEKFLEYLCDKTHNKIILYCVYEELIVNILSNLNNINISNIYNIVFALSYNPTVHFISTTSAFSGLYVLTDSIIISNVLYLSNYFQNITIATNDSKLASTAFLNNIKVIYKYTGDKEIEEDNESETCTFIKDIPELPISSSDSESKNVSDTSELLPITGVKIFKINKKHYILSDGVESISKNYRLNRNIETLWKDDVCYCRISIGNIIKFFNRNALYRLKSYKDDENLEFLYDI